MINFSMHTLAEVLVWKKLRTLANGSDWLRPAGASMRMACGRGSNLLTLLGACK